MYPVPDWLAERNIASWRDIVTFYEGITVESHHWGPIVAPLLRLVRKVAETDTAKSFRAGQSLYHLMISTAEQHGLRGSEPFLSVSPDEKSQRFRLEYWQRTGGKVLEKQLCDEADIYTHLDRMLARLWADTRGLAVATKERSQP